MLNTDLLIELLHAHSTPGDEGEVRAILSREWLAAGLKVEDYGKYAISAEISDPKSNDEKPILLICSHMDSPGFTVAAIDKNSARLIPLGGARFETASTPVVLKSNSETREFLLKPKKNDGGGRPSYIISMAADSVAHGDRACFSASPEITPEGNVFSPFLDNRLGCLIVCELAAILPRLSSRYRVVLGATACEEVGCLGAPVLAQAIRPDAVVCLDATYEDETQGVMIGKGPVLTLSDASVIVSPEERDRWKLFFAAREIPLQTEVYNYSGTDSRAFPSVGLSSPVYALLLPTRGNHTPREEGHLDDAEVLLKALAAMIEEGVP